MDKLDQRILELIKDNARLSYSEIGKSVGISRSRSAWMRWKTRA